jgi:hypothetical protein
MDGPIVVVGVPSALGGHLAGMERTPRGLRKLGLFDRIRAVEALAPAGLRDAGDLRIDPGFVAVDDRRGKNRSRICEFLPRQRDRADGVGGGCREPRRRDLHRDRHGLPGWRRRLGRDDAGARRPVD